MTMEHHGVWVLAEQSGGRVLRVSHELLARGRVLADKLGRELTAVIFGNRIDGGDLRGLIERGADRAIAVESPALEHFLPEPYAACLLALIEARRPEIVIAGATSTGRTLMPLAAVRANAGLTADCTVLDIEEGTGNLLQTRPAIGGNILATIKTPRHRPQMATVRPHSTQPAQPDAGRAQNVREVAGELAAARPADGHGSGGRGGFVIERIPAPAKLLGSRVRRTGFIPNPDRHGLQDADIVVCAGRGIKKGQNVELVRRLAGAMGAALGASRDVVDRGWLDYPHQVGLSGKTVNPRLYVGVGVSGSIQHLAGMQTAETIVAINTDPDAQIFRVADFGIVGNLFDVVPALLERLGAGAANAEGK